MSNESYKSFVGDLCRNFDKPWDSVGKKLDAAYPFLKHIPDGAWKDLTRLAMERWERWPSNFVKAILTLYRDTTQFEPQPVHYDPIEDFRFPVGLMQRAFEILQNEGYRPYVNYCNAVHMPQKDRERVEYKAEVCRANIDPATIVKGLITYDK